MPSTLLIVMANKMTFDASIIIAITGLVVGIGGVIGTMINAKLSAHKDELGIATTRLQQAIDKTNADNDRLRARIDEIERDNSELRALIREMERERSSNLRRIEILECQVADLEKQLTDAGITPVTKRSL